MRRNDVDKLVTWNLTPESVLLIDPSDKGKWVRKDSAQARERVIVGALRNLWSAVDREKAYVNARDVLAQIDAEQEGK